MDFRNIAISGKIAVGSSSLAKALSVRLGYKLRDASQIFRDISMHSGFDLEKQSKNMGRRIDLAVDSETRDTLKDQSKLWLYLSWLDS